MMFEWPLQAHCPVGYLPIVISSYGLTLFRDREQRIDSLGEIAEYRQVEC